MVPSSMPAPAYNRNGPMLSSATSEIPQSVPAQSADATTEATPLPNDDSQIVNYEARQDPQLIEPQLHSLQEFIDEGDGISPLGMEVQEERRKLASGEEADGLLIVAVTPNSPAAHAGLHGNQTRTHDVLTGAAVAAAMFFPPAILLMPLMGQIHLAESYDMIIGVDGSRVTNMLDFEDRMRDVQPGEIVYLSVVRNGNRVQIPVNVPAVLNAPGF
jgi:S1-C subfamily serine protease